MAAARSITIRRDKVLYYIFNIRQQFIISQMDLEQQDKHEKGKGLCHPPWYNDVLHGMLALMQKKLWRRHDLWQTAAKLYHKNMLSAIHHQPKGFGGAIAV